MIAAVKNIEQPHNIAWGIKRKATVICSLPLSLVLFNACAAPQPKVNITQTLQPNCAVTEERKVTYQRETIGEQSLIADFSQACANLQVLTLLAKSNENDAVGQISSIALLKMLSDSNEQIRNVILQTLYDQKKTPSDLVRAQTIYYLLKINDEQNPFHTRAAAAGNLLDFYYSNIGQEHLSVEERRSTIEEALEQRGTSLKKMDQVFSMLADPTKNKRKFCKVTGERISDSGKRLVFATCRDERSAFPNP
ncbi:MAG TPA: hypothetical protein DEA55_04325 [Rhodospirillaceae bacterium]|nr:hypothetical protein [Rhodospirillaceae bacterium]